MKRLTAFLICVTLCAGLLTGCGGGSGEPVSGGAAGGEKLRVVATVFPLYDWTRQLLGDRAEQVDLTLLLDGGTDLHSYQPTVEDMVSVSTCDLFLYVGGPSDDWVPDALSEAVNRDMVSVNLMEVLGSGVKEEEIVEGMEPEDEEDEDEVEYDEHVWLSLRNAKLFCGAIADALTQLDPEGASVYEANLAAYQARLDELDGRYESTVSAAPVNTLLFGDRFPFRYLVDDYGLTYYAAFTGCSAETEASFATIVFLSDKVDQLSLPAVLTIDGSDGAIARTIVENTASGNAQVLTMNSLQSASTADGTDYLSAMERNLEVLRTALGA